MIVRLAADLTRAFPGATGFSARNLKYMRALAKAWPDEPFVQRAAARLSRLNYVTVVERVKDEAPRFYALAKAHGLHRSRVEDVLDLLTLPLELQAELDLTPEHPPRGRTQKAVGALVRPRIGPDDHGG